LNQTEYSMNSKISCFLFLLLFSFFNASAQYTETINSNRPGFSQGAFSVGKNVIQFEGGFGLGKEEHELNNTKTDAFIIDYNIRYGVWKEELEISFIGAYQSNSNTYLNNASTDKISNFTSNTIGAKYLFYDPYRKKELEKPNLYSWKANNSFRWKDLIPAISIYAGANFDTSDNTLTPGTESSISPTVAIATQNNWGSWVFVTNFIGERITEDIPSYSYILTLTHTFTPNWSAFLENQGIKSDFYADQLIRGGAAYLINKDFQIDGSILVNFKDTPSRLYGRIGISYRLDLHKQDEFIEDKGKAGRDKKKEEKGTKKEKKKKRKDGVDFEEQSEENEGDGI